MGRIYAQGSDVDEKTDELQQRYDCTERTPSQESSERIKPPFVSAHHLHRSQGSLRAQFEFQTLGLRPRKIGSVGNYPGATSERRFQATASARHNAPGAPATTALCLAQVSDILSGGAQGEAR